jgi:hypothetical protein
VLGLAVTGVVVLIFDVTLSTTAAAIAGTGTFLGFTLLWFVLPITLRSHAMTDRPRT